MLKIIEGIKKTKTDYYLLYFNALGKCLDRVEGLSVIEIELIERKRIIFYALKMMIQQKTDKLNYAELKIRFNRMELVKVVMSTLTPIEFENIFPITKDFDGHRFERKDYFFTKKAIKDLGEHTVIGENIDDFLWDYHNWDICLFYVELMSTISSMRRLEGQKGLMEEFLEDKGITTYTLVEGEKNKKYLINNDTGEQVQVKKPIPRYLKLVKKNSPS